MTLTNLIGIILKYEVLQTFALSVCLFLSLKHEEHEARKPDEKSDDPADAASYREAKNNIGDYKLKTAEDFIVSEEERVTTEKKRKELLLLRKKVPMKCKSCR